MDITALINRDLVIPSEVKERPLTVVLYGVNAITEALLPNLLFRLENREAPSKIQIMSQTIPNQVVTMNDSMYGTYLEEDVSEIKASSLATKYAGAFSTDVEDIRPEYSRNNFTQSAYTGSLIVIDTLGDLSPELNGEHVLNETFKYVQNNLDFTYIQALISEDTEHVSVLRNNSLANNTLRLYGETIPASIVELAKGYMESQLNYNQHKAYMTSTRIMNIINAYITQGMNLKHTYSIFSYDNMVSEYRYFDKTTNVLFEYHVDNYVGHVSREFLSTFGNKIQKLIDKNKKIHDNRYVNINFFDSEGRREAVRVLLIGLYNDDWESLEYILTLEQLSELDTYKTKFRVIYRLLLLIKNQNDTEVIAISESLLEIVKEILGGSTEW